MMKKAFGSIFVLLAMLAVPSAASAASIQFTLDQGLSGGPFGSVVLTQTVADQVVVKVLLNAGNAFVGTGSAGNHPNFAWTLDPAILPLQAADITILEDGIDPPGTPTGPWNWVFGGAVTTSDSLGTFQYHFSCRTLPNPNPDGVQACGPGSSNTNPGPLEFLITKSGLTLESFIPSTGAGPGEHHYFVADILSGGNTGLVWADASVKIEDLCTFNCDTVVTPEPASMMLLGTGLLGLASRLRRRRGTS